MKIEEMFLNERTNEFNTIIIEFVERTGTSPFTDIDMKDDGEVLIDMIDEFEKVASEALGTDFNEVLTDYMQALIRSFNEEYTEVP